MQVHDDPSVASASKAGQTDAEKKAQKKAKKAAAKNQEAEKKNANNTSTNEDKGLEPPAPKDDDPDGTKAITAADGLDQAWKLLKLLLARKLTSIAVCLVVYDVSVRQSECYQSQYIRDSTLTDLHHAQRNSCKHRELCFQPGP